MIGRTIHHIHFKVTLAVAVIFVGNATVSATSLLGMQCPFGLPITPNSGMSMSMGGVGVAVSNDFNVSLRNPANLGATRKTVFSSLFLLDINTISDRNNGAASYHARFWPQQVYFGFPLGKAGAIALGFGKQRDGYARFEFPSRVLDSNFAELDSFRQTFSRDGGESSWEAAWAYGIRRWVRVGIAYQRVYARLQESRAVHLYSSFSNVYADSSIVDFRGNALRFGIQVPVQSITFGLAGQYFFSGDAFRYDVSYLGRPSTRNSSTRFTLRLPPSFTVGTSWQIDPRWLVALDLDMTYWKGYDSDGFVLGSNLRSVATTVSAGTQWVPAPDEITPKYWETISYRAGARYSQLPALSAYELALVVGIGLPLPAGGGLFDFVFELGQRNDSSYSRYTENFLRVGFGVNGGRKWAKSPQSTY